MKKKIIKEFLKYYFEEIKLTKGMVDNIVNMFDDYCLERYEEKIGDKDDPEDIELSVESFFEEMVVDIECELESWD
jgi:hypothetical protein